LVVDFVEKTLGGSVSPFVTYLVNDARLSQEELDDLKRLVRQLEEQKKEGET
jgi:predicted transcriptional regulator